MLSMNYIIAEILGSNHEVWGIYSDVFIVFHNHVDGLATKVLLTLLSLKKR